MLSRTMQLIRGAAFVVAASAPAMAGEIRVPADQPNIQAAIDVATEGQSVVVADGVWTGRGNANLTFRGKAITVRSENGSSACVIDAQRNGSAFVFNTGEGRDSILDGFTLTGADRSAVQCIGAGPNIINCRIDNNWNGIFGGGVLAEDGASPRIADCILSSNLAGMGAGVYVGNATATIERCEFYGNRTDLFGGGGIAAADGADVLVIASTFHGNQAIGFAGNGSGILITRARGTIVNALCYRNTANYIGGGIASVLSTTRIVNTTVVANSAASFGSGIYIDGDTRVENCISWNNTVDEIYVAAGNPTIRYSTIRGGWPGEGNRSEDPRFVNPAGDDYRLMAGSPVIDAGDSDAVPEGIEFDLDGQSRFVDDPATPDTGRGAPPIVDMGAFELQSGGGLQARVFGDCPGELTLRWANATPRRPMGVLLARTTGAARIPGGPCAGTTLGLGTSQLQLAMTLDTRDGDGQAQARAGTGVCGMYLQLVVRDGQPCATSSVVQLP